MRIMKPGSPCCLGWDLGIMMWGLAWSRLGLPLCWGSSSSTSTASLMVKGVVSKSSCSQPSAGGSSCNCRDKLDMGFWLTPYHHRCTLNTSNLCYLSSCLLLRYAYTRITVASLLHVVSASDMTMNAPEACCGIGHPSSKDLKLRYKHASDDST